MTMHELECFGGPFDGGAMRVREKTCTCCGEEYFAVTLREISPHSTGSGQADMTRDEVQAWFNRQPLERYIFDFTLKRATYDPEHEGRRHGH